MGYDPRIHHRQSTRLPHWDYSWGWWYYLTICTHKRQCLFGEVVEDTLVLNDVGKIVEDEWLKTPTIRPNVALDDYVIMPNHLHAIIIINDPKQSEIRPAGRRGVSQYAPTKLHSSSQTLGAIIRGFKGASTKRINLLRSMPASQVWQRNYYDHIIRNDADLTRIRTYLAENPLRWSLDEENPSNVKT